MFRWLLRVRRSIQTLCAIIAMFEHLRTLDCDVLTSDDADRANQGIPDHE